MKFIFHHITSFPYSLVNRNSIKSVFIRFNFTNIMYVENKIKILPIYTMAITVIGAYLCLPHLPTSSPPLPTSACLPLLAYLCLPTSACLPLLAYLRLPTSECLPLHAYLCLPTSECLPLHAYLCLPTSECLPLIRVVSLRKRPVSDNSTFLS